jgi:chorismate dehydratase
MSRHTSALDVSSSAPSIVSTTVRLGVIDYLNVAPIYDALVRQATAPGGLPGVELVAGIPAQMNRALATGEIDCSNVSSFAFGAHVRDWLLVPKLSVAAQGRVESVLLFSWHEDWRALDGASIALSDHSATSVQLVRLLCERRYGITPCYVTRPPDLEAMLADHEAALLIGDVALHEYALRRPIGGRRQPHVFDLAAEWQAWMGLPFVFAVWAVRAERDRAIRDSGVVALLHESKARGLAELDRLATEASKRQRLPVDFCARYLRLLDYDLSERDLAGLRAFLEMAVPGFCWSDVRLLEE